MVLNVKCDMNNKLRAKCMFILVEKTPTSLVASDSKFVSVGVQSLTEINVSRGCTVILYGICQLR